MLHPFDIRIHQGFGPIRFGASMDDVRTHFGSFDEEEIMETGDDNASALVWHYWSNGFSFFFDIQDGHRLSCIETDNADVQLFGQPIFGLNEKAVCALLKENGYTSHEEELHEWGEKRVSFDDAAIDFYFEKGKLVSVNFGIPPTSDGLFPFTT